MLLGAYIYRRHRQNTRTTSLCLCSALGWLDCELGLTINIREVDAFFLTTRGWTPLDCLEDRAMTIARRFRGFGGFARRLYSWGLSRTISISLYTLFGITEIIIHVQPSHDTRHRDLLILNPYLNANIGRSSTVQIRSKVSGTKPPKLYR